MAAQTFIQFPITFETVIYEGQIKMDQQTQQINPPKKPFLLKVMIYRPKTFSLKKTYSTS